MKKITTILLAATLSLTACDIERLPNGSLASENITSDPDGSFGSLLNGSYAQLKNWSDPMHRCGEYAGDNVAIRGGSTDSFFEFISYVRTPNNGRLNTFWNNSYKAIAQASNAINMISEGQNTQLDNQLGECYFIRGMMYFYLCRAYGRPYYDNPDKNLGVPIVNGTPEDMGNLQLPDRSSVKATYRQAIDDLKKSAEMMTLDKKSIYASKEAAYALLSRVYLYMSGTYGSVNTVYADSAKWYATEVIKSPKYTLLPRAEFMKYNELLPENNKETIFAIKRLKSENIDYANCFGGFYANIGGKGWGEMFASEKYLQLLDETGRNDWANKKIVDARAAFIEPQYLTGKVFRFIKDIYPLLPRENAKFKKSTVNYAQYELKEEGTKLYCIEKQIQYKYGTDKDGNKIIEPIKEGEISVTKEIQYELKPIDAAQGIYEIEAYNTNTQLEPVYITCKGMVDTRIRLNRANPEFYVVKSSRETGENSHLHSPVISRLGEIYLNRAEAYAKLGDYEYARTDLNAVRERSLPGKGYSAAEFTAETAQALIDKERQLELAFQAERSYDVYRNGGKLTRLYPGAHDVFQEVEAKDFRVVYYIPQDAINSYSGTLTQNPTSN